MIKKLLLLVSIMFYHYTFSQFAGERSEVPYTAIDGVAYKKGDIIQISTASKGNEFQTIYIFKYETALDTGLKVLDAGSKILGIFSGGSNSSTPSSNESKIVLATKVINGHQGKINHFRVLTLKDAQKTKVTYAIVEYLEGYRLAVPIDLALKFREIYSKNPEFSKQLFSSETNNKDNETLVKSFNNNFDVKFISAVGDKNNQTVKITITIKHQLVHQDVKFLYDDYYSNIGMKYSQAFDFEGNQYELKDFTVGSQTSNYVLFKVPTNILVKASVTYKKILPSVQELSFLNILTSYGNSDDGNRERSSIEISNVKIDWK